MLLVLRSDICIPFHSNPSCNRKNSLKARSWRSVVSILPSGCAAGDDEDEVLRLLGDEDVEEDVDDDDAFRDEVRQICASRLSICRRPLRIFVASFEEM